MVGSQECTQMMQAAWDSQFGNLEHGVYTLGRLQEQIKTDS